ncbi:MAG: ABC transporter permease [Lachnospiraceae bacterium]|nr:ABC transporter permease [Lachnospiraceae bacterium]
MNKTNMLSTQIQLSPEDFSPITLTEREQLDTLAEPVSFWQDAWRRLKQNKIATAAMIVLIIIAIFAFLGPIFSPFDYDEQIRGSENLAPCLKHPFGTDGHGRDLMVRAMVGCRISLLIGILASFMVLIIGSIYGAIAGLCGGMVDNIMMRIVELIYSVPEILIIIIIKLVIDTPLTEFINSHAIMKPFRTLGSGVVAIFIVYGLLYWVGMARIIRGQVLQLKEMEYVNSAVALGSNKRRLIAKHLLPNCIGQLIVTTALQIPSAIFTESFLSFLGLGVSVPMASLGSLASDALNGINSYPYRLFFPALIISLIILSFNLFADGLRDALDPKMKK